jgi:chemotaxis methyl-accepting protein methylase
MSAWTCQPPPVLSDPQFSLWQALVEEHTGIDFSQHRAILQGGLCQRLRQLRAEPALAGLGYDDYYRLVTGPAGQAEWQRLIEEVAVKETRFFRQPAAFELVGEYLRRRLRQTPETLSLWSVGCATGEEAYSLAIVASEVSAGQQPPPFGVVATDLCPAALATARTGCFPVRRLEGLPPPLRHKYFEAGSAGGERARQSLRDRLCFLRSNLLQPETLPPLSMDVIFCQNVLVYFRRWRIKQIVDALVARLKPGGLLVLGPGEAAQWQHPAMVRTASAGVSAWLKSVVEQQGEMHG